MRERSRSDLHDNNTCSLEPRLNRDEAAGHARLMEPRPTCKLELFVCFCGATTEETGETRAVQRNNSVKFRLDYLPEVEVESALTSCVSHSVAPRDPWKL